MGKKIKIPKNKDIEEIVYENEDNVSKSEKKEEKARTKFVENVKINPKFLDSYNKRKDAQNKEEEKKVELLKTIAKIKKNEEEKSL